MNRSVTTLVTFVRAFSFSLFLTQRAWTTPADVAQCTQDLRKKVKEALTIVSKENKKEITSFCQEYPLSTHWRQCLVEKLKTTPLRLVQDSRYVCHPNFNPDHETCVIQYLTQDRFMSSHNSYLTLCAVKHPNARACVKDLILHHGFSRPGYETNNVCKRRSMRQRQCLIKYYKSLKGPSAPFGPTHPVQNETDAELFCEVSHPKDQECVARILNNNTVNNFPDAITLCMRASDQRHKCEEIFYQYGVSLWDILNLEICKIPDYEVRSCIKDSVRKWVAKYWNVTKNKAPILPASTLEIMIHQCNIFSVQNALTTGLLSPTLFACEFIRTENMPATYNEKDLFPPKNLPP